MRLTAEQQVLAALLHSARHRAREAQGGSSAGKGCGARESLEIVHLAALGKQPCSFPRWCAAYLRPAVISTLPVHASLCILCCPQGFTVGDAKMHTSLPAGCVSRDFTLNHPRACQAPSLHPSLPSTQPAAQPAKHPPPNPPLTSWLSRCSASCLSAASSCGIAQKRSSSSCCVRARRAACCSTLCAALARSSGRRRPRQSRRYLQPDTSCQGDGEERGGGGQGWNGGEWVLRRCRPRQSCRHLRPDTTCQGEEGWVGGQGWNGGKWVLGRCRPRQSRRHQLPGRGLPTPRLWTLPAMPEPLATSTQVATLTSTHWLRLEQTPPVDTPCHAGPSSAPPPQAPAA